MTFFQSLSRTLIQVGASPVVDRLNTKTNAYTGLALGLASTFFPTVAPYLHVSSAPPSWAGIAVTTASLLLATVGRPKDFTPTPVPPAV